LRADIDASDIAVSVKRRFPWQEMAMTKIKGLCIGESLVGEGNEVAHIDLILGPRGGSAEIAFANCLTNQKEGHSALLAVIAPNLMTKPPTVMFNKVTIKGAKQALQMFGPAQHAVAKPSPTALPMAPFRRRM
jgi:5,6,7,8-tetrahydromethanopterin hydro-lyase